MVYSSLFLTAFLAATLLPAYSEVLFAGLLLKGYDPLLLWLTASSGNTLGSAVNWALATFFLRFQDRRWFPFREKQ
ncbi:MAG: DedA family protein, partial [Halioglobus sp.]|nr:DedA family protein [Halioglobus sp.]